MEIDDEIGSKLQYDPIDSRFVIAKHFLRNIYTKVPHFQFTKNYNREMFFQEAYIDSFLFFCNSAIDFTINSISKNLNLSIRNVTVYKLLDKLDSKNELHSDIKTTISNYFSQPVYEDKEISMDEFNKITEKQGILDPLDTKQVNGKCFKRIWDEKNTFLWQLRESRNKISHSQSLPQVVKMYDKAELRCLFELRNENRGLTGEIFEKRIENPQEYFLILFSKSCNFVNDIRKIFQIKEKDFCYDLDLDFSL